MTAIPSTSAVWHASPTLELLNSLSGGSLIGHLGIEFTEIGADSLTARMPVDERTRQPLGLLHSAAPLWLSPRHSPAGAATLTHRPGPFRVRRDRDQRQSPAPGARWLGHGRRAPCDAGPEHPGLGDPDH